MPRFRVYADVKPLCMINSAKRTLTPTLSRSTGRGGEMRSCSCTASNNASPHYPDPSDCRNCRRLRAAVSSAFAHADDSRSSYSRSAASQEAGRLAEAEAVYRQILSVHPNHPDPLHLLGSIALSGRGPGGRCRRSDPPGNRHRPEGAELPQQFRGCDRAQGIWISSHSLFKRH